MTEQEILFLNQDIVIGLIDLIDRKDVFTAVERAFGQHGRKKVQMPPKTYLNFSEHNGDARIMPSSTDFSDIFGTKIVTVFPENSKIGLPTVIGTILLNSKETGVLLAIMDGTTITNLRTGLAGAVAAKWLARENSSVAGMVGLGKQAETQLLALMPAGDIQTVRVYDLNEDAKFAFKKWAEEEFDIEVIPTDSVKEACDCDILVTTTPVRSPVVKSEWIQKGTYISAIGADAEGKQELDSRLMMRAKIVVDDIVQASHSGEINVPFSTGIISKENIHCELGEVVAGIKPGRENDDEIIVFDSTGLAIQDLAIAMLVYEKALECGVGTKLEL